MDAWSPCSGGGLLLFDPTGIRTPVAALKGPRILGSYDAGPSSPAPAGREAQDEWCAKEQL
jgi:hypothetical protein